jgi:hypothetical protein
MGFLDSIKKAVGGAVQQQTGQQPAPQPPPPAAPPAPAAAQPPPQRQAPRLDTAGFDPAGDEEGFFNAVLHMESEGEMGGTDASRAEIMARYGIRDRSHWRDVKEAVYQVLGQKHGSMDVVMQRELNWRMGETQKRMQQQVAKKAASGEMAPVEGITLEAWAAFNAAIVQGANLDDLLKGASVTRAKWDKATAEWNARMARDTTFAIAQVYGNAFQAASKGKYSEYAKEANAARAANRDLNMPPPITMEKYWELTFEQSYALKQGRDPQQTLKDLGLSIVDWADLGSYMGYYFHRTAQLKWKEHEATMKAVQARLEAKYEGLKADVDIQF